LNAFLAKRDTIRTIEDAEWSRACAAICLGDVELIGSIRVAEPAGDLAVVIDFPNERKNVS